MDGAIFNDDLLRHLTLRRVKSLLIGSRSNPWDVFELSTDAIVEFLYKPGGGSLVVQSGWVNAGNVFLEAMLEVCSDFHLGLKLAVNCFIRSGLRPARTIKFTPGSTRT